MVIICIHFFQSDFELMCKNCMTYNQQDTVYYKAAKRLLHLGQKSMVPDKLMLLKREVPLMSTLTKDQVGREGEMVFIVFINVHTIFIFIFKI